MGILRYTSTVQKISFNLITMHIQPCTCNRLIVLFEYTSSQKASIINLKIVEKYFNMKIIKML